MTRELMTVRCVILALSAILAMPWVTDASYVRGGDDIPNCDTSTLNSNGSCVAKSQQSCTDKKKQCTACIAPSTTKTQNCAEDGTACAGGGCETEQKNSKLSGDTCIAVNCN